MATKWSNSLDTNSRSISFIYCTFITLCFRNGKFLNLLQNFVSRIYNVLHNVTYLMSSMSSNILIKQFSLLLLNLGGKWVQGNIIWNIFRYLVFVWIWIHESVAPQALFWKMPNLTNCENLDCISWTLGNNSRQKVFINGHFGHISRIYFSSTTKNRNWNGYSGIILKRTFKLSK